MTSKLREAAMLALPDAQPVAWMTHHEPPMIFPDKQEAESYCDEEDGPPVPLYADPQPVIAPYATSLTEEECAATYEAMCKAWNPESDGKTFVVHACRFIEAAVIARQATS